MGTYNRERKAAILRHLNNYKDALWGVGFRAPIGNRIAHAAAALTWVTLNTEKPDDEAITLADCIPQSYESFESFTPDGKKNEAMGKPPWPWTCLRGRPSSMLNYSPFSSAANTRRGD